MRAWSSSVGARRTRCNPPESGPFLAKRADNRSHGGVAHPSGSGTRSSGSRTAAWACASSRWPRRGALRRAGALRRDVPPDDRPRDTPADRGGRRERALAAGDRPAHRDRARANPTSTSSAPSPGRPAPRPASARPPAGDLDRSLRHRELRRPHGFDDELRAVLSDAAGTWGALTLMREAGRRTSRRRDVRFVASLGGLLADGLRRAMLFRRRGRGGGDGDTGVCCSRADDGVEMTNDAADRWLDELRGGGPAGGSRSWSTPSPAGLDTPPATRRRSRPASARVRTRRRALAGRARLAARRRPDSRVAVLLEAARPPELAPMIADAYGFTDRERAVTELVARGLSTNEIASSCTVALHGAGPLEVDLREGRRRHTRRARGPPVLRPLRAAPGQRRHGGLGRMVRAGPRIDAELGVGSLGVGRPRPGTRLPQHRRPRARAQRPGGTPDRLALTFADRRWTYAELDRAAGRVAAALLGLGLEHGRPRRGVRQELRRLPAAVPRLRARRPGPRPGQLQRPRRRAGLPAHAVRAARSVRRPRAEPTHVDAVDDRLASCIAATLRDDVAAALGARRRRARCTHEDGVARRRPRPAALHLRHDLAPKGAMLTHRALVHEYVVLHRRARPRRRRRAAARAAALPLGADARVPDAVLAVGATNHLSRRPTSTTSSTASRATASTRCSSRPRSGSGSPTTPASPTRDLRQPAQGVLRRVDHARARAAEAAASGCPSVGFYNCFGQSEIGPLATVLRPEEHARAPRLGRPPGAVRRDPRRRRRDARRRAGRARRGRLPLAAAVHAATGASPRRPRRRSRGGWFHSGDLVRIDEEGYMFVVDRIKDVINTGGVLVASREVEDALYTPPRGRRGRGHRPAPRALDRGDHRRRRAHARTSTPDALIDARQAHARAATRCPRPCTSSTSCPRTPSGKLLKRELRRRLGGSESAVGRVPG